MPQVKTFDATGAEAAPASLPEAWFADRPSSGALYQSVRAYLANQRQGTASTLNRAAVAGSKSKPWRQKGTGRARAGTRTSPIWRGGGIVFGPTPREHRQRVPKRIRRLALRSALREKLDEGALFVVRLDAFERPQTSRLARALKAISDGREILLLTNAVDENLFLSARNIAGLTIKPFRDVTAYEVMRHAVVLIEASATSPGAAPWLEEGEGGGTAERGEES